MSKLIKTIFHVNKHCCYVTTNTNAEARYPKQENCNSKEIETAFHNIDIPAS